MTALATARPRRPGRSAPLAYRNFNTAAGHFTVGTPGPDGFAEVYTPGGRPIGKLRMVRRADGNAKHIEFLIPGDARPCYSTSVHAAIEYLADQHALDEASLYYPDL